MGQNNTEKQQYQQLVLWKGKQNWQNFSKIKWVGQTTDTYFSQLCSLEVQDQDSSQLGFWWVLSFWLIGSNEGQMSS